MLTKLVWTRIIQIIQQACYRHFVRVFFFFVPYLFLCTNCTEFKKDPNLIKLNTNYLDFVSQSHSLAVDDLLTHWEMVGRVKTFAIQDVLDARLDNCSFTAEEKHLYRQMQTYFDAMKALLASLERSDFTQLTSQYGHLIDLPNFQWTDEFKAFAEAERLFLPPLLVAGGNLGDLSKLSSDELIALYNTVHAIVGDDVDAYFQSLRIQAEADAHAATRSMRHVKAILQLKVAFANDVVSFFRQFSYTDGPDFVDAGISEHLKGFANWYFFDNDGNRLPWSVTLDRMRNQYRRYPESLYWLDDSVYDHLEDNSLEAIRSMVLKIRREFPGMVFGFYRYWPECNYRCNLPPDSEGYIEQMQENDRRGEMLADVLDVIYPSNYHLHSASLDPDADVQDPGLLTWKTKVRVLIAKAHEQSELYYKQPLIDFVWPQYHTNGGLNPLGLQYFSGEIFRESLGYVLDQGVDGFAIYNYRQAWQPWFDDFNDNEYSWYEATLDTIAEVRSGPPICAE